MMVSIEFVHMLLRGVLHPELLGSAWVTAAAATTEVKNRVLLDF